MCIPQPLIPSVPWEDSSLFQLASISIGPPFVFLVVCLLVLFTGDLVHLYELTVIEDACLVLIVLQLLFLTLVFLPSFIFQAFNRSPEPHSDPPFFTPSFCPARHFETSLYRFFINTLLFYHYFYLCQCLNIFKSTGVFGVCIALFYTTPPREFHKI